MIIASALASRAQVEKNDWLLGGTFSFGANSGSSQGISNSSSNSNLNPELGWAAAKNSIIGFRGGLSTGTSKDNNDNKMTTTSYSAGLFWKRLFPINEKVGWYGDLSGGYSYSKTRYSYPVASSTQEYSANGYYASITPGVYYKPSGKVLLNAGIGGVNYGHSKSSNTSTGESKSNSFYVNLLGYFTFGVSFIIGKSHQM